MYTRIGLVALFAASCVGGVAARAQERTDFPPEAMRRYEQGKALMKQGQVEQAVRAFEEAIQLGLGEFPRVHLQQALTSLELKKYDTAIAQYTKFINQFGLERSCRA
jgi:outer membrane protein assembly factor BamD (BamD/ComL family)